MPDKPTQAQLIEMGKKAYEAKEKEKLRTKVNACAVKKLIAAHRDEYKQLQIEEGQRLGAE